MKLNRIIQGLLIVLIAQSCATKKLTEQGNTAYDSGAYDTTLSALGKVIEKRESQNKKAEPEIYFKAGMAAHKLGKTDTAREYLEKAERLEFSSPELYASQAKIYKEIDNLSKEMSALEEYYEKYPEGEEIDDVKVRLFETYVESENWKLAVDLWSDLKEEVRDNLDLLTGYLIANENLENDELCDKLARQILEKDSNNIPALEWLAKKHFWDAEDTYIREMKAYEKNKTRKQYKKLMSEWDGIWENFRKSRDYFLKLYKLDPKPEYAEYLGNVYTRLDDEQKAEYYYQKAE
ncbi:MAG: tetratricopeptide repeat protein [Bacteroidales bacterium]